MSKIKFQPTPTVTIVALTSIILIKLWLVQGLLLAATKFTVDDLLFLGHAQSIIGGNWLGSYDYGTLVKGPGYPLWIAAGFFSHIPLLLSQQLFYTAACCLLTYSLAPYFRNDYRLLALLFVVVLFEPQSYNSASLRLVRDFLYSSQHLLVLAGLIGVMTQRRRLARMLCWALGLGFALAFFWITREEGFLILPAYALLTLYTGWLLGLERGERWKLRLGVLLVPLLVCSLLIAGIRHQNERVYGVSAVVEQNAPPFQRASAALSRVKQSSWNRYIPLPAETRMRIYRASPAFAELQPFLEGAIGQMWTRMSVSRLPELAATPDIGGGWYSWALLNSVQAAGHYQSAPEAARYYSQVAAEVHNACDTGRLDCYPSGSNSTVHHPGELTRYVWRSFADLGLYLASYEQNEPGQPPNLLDNDNGLYRLYRSITLNEIAGPPEEDSAKPVSWKLAVLQKIYAVYRMTAPVLYVLAGACLLAITALSYRRRRVTPLTVVTVAFLLDVFSRLVGLAYIDATACSARAYLGPVYPLAIAASLLLMANLAEIIKENKTEHPPQDER